MAAAGSNNVQMRRRGTRQQDRFLTALMPSYVSVDEKSLAQNIEFLYRYAEFIKLYDPNNSLFGSWQWMLQNDSSFTMASIETAEVAQYPAGYSKLLKDYAEALDTAGQEKAVSELFLYTDLLAYNLADWVVRIQLVPNEQLGLLGRLTELMQTNLGQSLGYWQACLNGLTFSMSEAPSAIAGRNFYGDVATIMAHLSPVLALPPTDQLPDPQFTNLDSYFAYLQRLYKNLYRCNVQVKAAMEPMLAATLQQPNHEPHNALLLTFEQLMLPAIDSLNTLTQRHLDYYYRQVLQFSPRPPVPDQVRLLFVLKNGIETALVPKGTAVLAGKGQEGEDILYTTDQDLVVNRVKVVQFKTVFNAGVNSLMDGQGGLYAAPVANSADGLGGKFPAGVPTQWAPFGSDQAGVPAGSQTMVPATVGFAFSDPVLLMRMGQRSIRLAISFTDDSFTQLQEAMLALAKPGQSVNQLFTQFMGKAFGLSYTGPKGWVDAVISQPPSLFSSDSPLGGGSSNTGNGFWLECSMDASAPAVIAYDEALHGPGYTPGKPVVRLLLQPGQHIDVTLPIGDEGVSVLISPYNLLRQVNFSRIDITVKVAGKTDLALQNDSSALNPQKPFQPFGPAPEWGDSLYIGSPEAFRKRLKSLTIHMDWTKLPSDALGFAAYYDVWNEVRPLTAFHNSSFRVAVSLLQQRTWVPLPPLVMATPPVMDYPLFAWETTPPATVSTAQDAPFSPVFWLLNNLQPANPSLQQTLIGDSVKDGKLLATTDWANFDLSGVKDGIVEIAASSLEPTYAYTTDMPTGYVKLSLSGPVYGFGNSMYQDVANEVNRTNIENLTAAAKSTSTDKPVILAAPKPAFAPTGKGISIDYEATESYVVGQVNSGIFYLIQPFGVTQAVIATTATALLPDFAVEGTLYLGLEAVNAPQTLTLLVQVDENSAADNTPTRPTVTLSYLDSGTWTAFKSMEVIADGTNNFSQSGIISLMLNHSPSSDGGWFSSVPNASSLLWIRATVDRDSIATCKVILMDTQAVSATYQVGPSANSHLAQPLAADSIKKMVNPLPAITKVIQPFDGFGGRPGEDSIQLYTRIHERLRHKERGIAAWDIERILLEAFPQIGLVNCFGHSSTVSAKYPGQALVIVFPGGSQLSQPNPYTPKFNLSHLLAMNGFLQALVPQEMKATVANPPYEFLQVKAAVRFSPGLDPGYYLSQLNADLCDYIAPWVQAPDTYNPYDTLLSPALIRGFIHGLAYVDSLVTFHVYQYRKVNDGNEYAQWIGDYDYFQPSTPSGILTSDSHHLLSDADSPTAARTIGMGFVVPKAQPSSVPGIGTLSIGREGVGDSGDEQEYLVIMEN